MAGMTFTLEPLLRGAGTPHEGVKYYTLRSTDPPNGPTYSYKRMSIKDREDIATLVRVLQKELMKDADDRP